jgi:membrane protease YdiL (CAAX protease family)
MNKKVKKLLIAIGVSAAFMVAYLLFQLAFGFVFQFFISIYVSAVNSASGTPLEYQDLVNKTVEIYMQNAALIMVVSGLVFILLSFIIILAVNKKGKWDLAKIFEVPQPTSRAVPMILFCYLSGLCFNIAMVNLIAVIPLPESWIESNNESVQTVLGGSVIAAYLATFVIAPLAEELIFRGVAYNLLRDAIPLKRRWAMLISCIVVSLLFGLYHGNFLQGIYTFILSIVLVIVHERTGTLWSAVLVHAGFNSILVQSLLAKVVYAPGWEILNATIFFYAGLLFVFLVFRLTKNCKQNAADRDNGAADDAYYGNGA